MKRWWLWPVLMVCLVLAIRLVFALNSSFFSSSAAYFAVDQVSYEGSFFELGVWPSSFLWSLILRFFSLFFDSEIVLKVVPNIFASLLTIPVYLISFRLSKNHRIAVATSFLANVVPVYLVNTFNQVSALSLAVPLFFMLIYWWLAKRTYLFVGGLVFFVFFHPLSLIFILSILAYFLLSLFDRLKLNSGEYELGLFSIFFTLWVHFLLFKKSIIFHGANVLWRNIPAPLLSGVFARVSLLDAVVLVGAYPVAQGVYALYKTALKNPSRGVNWLYGVIVTSGFLLWFKLADLESGMILLGVALAILFAKWSIALFAYITQTRLAKFANVLVFTSFTLAIVSTAIPAFALTKIELDNSITSEEVAALDWVSENLEGDANILAPVDYGNYISVLANRTATIDSSFLNEVRSDERYEDVLRVMDTPFETEAVELMDKYGATHILLPPKVKDIRYSNGVCFDRVYERRVRIYEKSKACELRVVV